MPKVERFNKNSNFSLSKAGFPQLFQPVDHKP